VAGGQIDTPRSFEQLLCDLNAGLPASDDEHGTVDLVRTTVVGGVQLRDRRRERTGVGREHDVLTTQPSRLLAASPAGLRRRRRRPGRRRFLRWFSSLRIRLAATRAAKNEVTRLSTYGRPYFCDRLDA